RDQEDIMKTTDGADARDEHLSDTAFERLRAADPAASLTPDLVSLRAAVDADAVAATGAPRRRRDARWFQLAAVSAGVLAVGLGGFVLGERAAEPSPSAEEKTESAVGLEPAVGGDTADGRAVGPDAASSASS